YGGLPVVRSVPLVAYGAVADVPYTEPQRGEGRGGETTLSGSIRVVLRTPRRWRRRRPDRREARSHRVVILPRLCARPHLSRLVFPWALPPSAVIGLRVGDTGGRAGPRGVRRGGGPVRHFRCAHRRGAFRHR